MSNPAISILMPAYNVEKYIGEAIDSMLNQTFKDFEFIIVDDASTDGTLSAVQKYTDPRVKIIRNEKNAKLAASLNKGLQIVRGKYIARMDADDISHPERLQKLYDFLEKNPAIDMCGSAMKVFGAGEESVWEYKTEDKVIKAGLLWTSTMPHGAVMMRAETILKHKLYFDETFLIGQDWKYWSDVKDYVTFSNLKEPLYFYRRAEQSITMQFSHQSGDRYAVMHRKMLSDLGVPFSDHELLLHQFIVGIFTVKPSVKTVNEAHAWIRKIIRYNREVKKHDPATFEMIARERWSQLFFKMLPFGFSISFSYLLVSDFSFSRIIYYLKYLAGSIVKANK